MARHSASERHHTYADYRLWPDDERWELIDGVAYAMSPAPTRLHQEVVGELLTQLRTHLRGHRCRVYVAPFDVRLPRSGEADDAVDTVVQPDLPVVCDRSKLDERGCRGAPDWVIEVLSRSSAAHDQIRKRDLYERHGVREYRLVHPQDRIVVVYRLRDGAYGRPDVHETRRATSSEVVPGLAIDWSLVGLDGEPAEGGPSAERAQAAAAPAADAGERREES